MLKNIKKRLKNQRGLTLVELLAVVVILGIISAIAVPSIGKLIENTKIDAHIANAQQIANSAKLLVTQNNTKITTTETIIELEDLIEAGVIDEVKDPSVSNSTYNIKNTKVYISKVGNQIVYKVALANAGTTVGEVTTSKYYTIGTGTGSVNVYNLARTNVTIPE